MNKIKINEKEYDVECNAFTRVLYKQHFGKGIFQDFSKIQEINHKTEMLKKQKDKSKEEIQAEVEIHNLETSDELIDIIFKIAYIEIKTVDPKFMSFEDWLATITTINFNDEWVSQVMEICSNCFRG